MINELLWLHGMEQDLSRPTDLSRGKEVHRDSHDQLRLVVGNEVEELIKDDA